MNKPTALIILDGFGYSKETKHNAITQAHTPNLDSWLKTYPWTTLQASGKAVGLLPGVIGNSEAGHTTIGAGKIILQPLANIHAAIDDNSLFTNKTLVTELQKVAQAKSTLHLIGLLSDAGVHSHIKHLFAYIKAAEQQHIVNIVIHPILDGRDTPPQSAQTYLQQLQNFIKNKKHITIGSLHGRFYAMDRDNNWERTQKSYHTLTSEQNSFDTIFSTETSKTTPAVAKAMARRQVEQKRENWNHILKKQYGQGVFDEFIPPTQCNPEALVKDGDGVLFFNFRPERMRQLTALFLTHKKLSACITPTEYSSELNTAIIFPKKEIKNTLKERLSKQGKTIFTIAETEKYAHVTYFLGGGKEQAFENETQVMVPSVTTTTYVDHPKMSAQQITKKVVESLSNDPKDFYIINFANADMVGHSGNMQATQKAVECLDAQLGLLHNEIVVKQSGAMFITADHGNAEQMFDEQSQQPKTAHTTNPVPFVWISKHASEEKLKGLKNLADIADFIVGSSIHPSTPNS